MKYVIDMPDEIVQDIKENYIGNDVVYCNIRYTATPLEEVLEDIKAEIEQVKAIMNEEIIEHDRKDLINFVNGLNQCLCIIDKHISGKE